MAQFRRDRHHYLANGNTIFEVVMLADQYGNMVGPANPSGVAVDAFGRARFSQPVTLFDSASRYHDNNKFVTANTATATYAFNANSSMTAMTVDTTNSAKVQRETKKVFAYQPGKSLLILNTFVMNEAKEGLTQRVGYYNDNNGVFLEQSGTTIRFGIRSKTTGTVAHEYATQSEWNIDTLLGSVDSSPSQKTLDLTKAQIFWCDIEWLGVGSVRCGFVIDGQLIHCHTFHHANDIASTYMTTACLPIRYEIENTAETDSSSTLYQICSSVISEGGYEVRGRAKSVGLEPTSQRELLVAGTYYPAMSLQLKSSTIDAIAVPTNISVLGINQASYRYKILTGATITGANWTSAGADSSVEYDANTTSTLSGGTVLSSGYFSTTNQATAVIRLDSDLFKFQLERNGLTGTPTPITLAITSGTATCNVVASFDWEEYT